VRPRKARSAAGGAASPPTVLVRIRRQDGPDRPGTRRWEQFEVDRKGATTVAHLLDRINLQPVTRGGDAVEPIAWESSCTWPTCGSCAMVINGCAALACDTAIDAVRDKRNTVTLEPLSKFPLRRDLWVDQSEMDRARTRLQGWLEPQDDDELPAETEARRRERLAHARCTSCGCCLEACPEYRLGGAYGGAAAIGHAHHALLFRPRDGLDRLEALLGPSSIVGCGRAHNCVAQCSHDVPLDDALAQISRKTTGHWLKHLWRRPKGSRG